MRHLLYSLTVMAVLLSAGFICTPPTAAQQYLPGQYVPPGAYVPPGTYMPPTGPVGPPAGFPVPNSTAPSTIAPRSGAGAAPYRTGPMPEVKPSTRVLAREFEPLVRGLNYRDCMGVYDVEFGVTRAAWRRLCAR